MNIHLESILRSIGIFLSVFFTLQWGNNSKPKYDTYVMILCVISAIFASAYF
jgi:hypothetical protein